MLKDYKVDQLALLQRLNSEIARYHRDHSDARNQLADAWHDMKECVKFDEDGETFALEDLPGSEGWEDLWYEMQNAEKHGELELMTELAISLPDDLLCLGLVE